MKALRSGSHVLATAALAISWVAVFAVAASAGVEPMSQRFEKGGLAIDFSLTPVSGTSGLIAGTDAIVTLRVSDARSGAPVSGIRPRAWFSARRSEMVANETECTDKVRAFAGGGLTARADIDLNSYFLLTLNHDKTISFINPLVALNSTKMESIVLLPGVGADWLQSRDKHILYVTMPDQDAVAIIDTVTRKLIKIISTGEGSKPTRLALQPDGRKLWVGLDGMPQVAAIDTEINALLGTVETGSGLHNIVATGDNRYVYVTNSSDDTITGIETKTLRNVRAIKVGKTPVAVAYSDMSRMVYVAALNGDSISVIAPESQEIVETTKVKPGIVALRFEPSGRYIFAVNQIDSSVSVLDASTNQVTAVASVVKEPDQITFTQRYAYIRGIGSENFSLMDLSEIRQGKLYPLDIQAGRMVPSTEPTQIGVAAMIVPTPEGNSVMIANAPDRMMYFYQEGMMAPMGTFSNYKRMPRGVMILDRSLAETAPGSYSVPVKLPSGGRFDVPVLLDQPRIVNCFQVSIANSPDATITHAGPSVQVERVSQEQPITSRQAQALRFRIRDARTREPLSGLKDVLTLTFRPPGTWQQRHSLNEIGGGIYELRQKFPNAGMYTVVLSIASRGIGYADLPPHVIAVANNDSTKGTEQSEIKAK